MKLVNGKNTVKAKNAMNPAVNSLLMSVLNLALPINLLMSVPALWGRDEPMRKENIDWKEISL